MEFASADIRKLEEKGNENGTWKEIILNGFEVKLDMIKYF